MTDQLILTTAQRASIENLLAEVGFDKRQLVKVSNMLQSLPMVDSEPVDIDAIAVNLMRFAGLEKNKAREIARFFTTNSISPQPLKPITADDVTDEMVSAIENAMLAIPNVDNLGDDEFNRHGAAAIYNAVIKHKGDTK